MSNKPLYRKERKETAHVTFPNNTEQRPCICFKILWRGIALLSQTLDAFFVHKSYWHAKCIDKQHFSEKGLNDYWTSRVRYPETVIAALRAQTKSHPPCAFHPFACIFQ